MGIFNFFKKKEMKIKKIKDFSNARDGYMDVLRILKEKGDNANISRPVRHYCYFKKKEELNKFLGLAIIQQAQKEPLVKGIVILMDSTMKEEAIFSQINEIAALTAGAGGQYDGWETSIEK